MSDTHKDNLQELEKEFNQLIYESGGLNYQKQMVKRQLAQMDVEINNRIQKAENIAKKVNAAREMIKAEVNQAVKEGKANGQAPAAQPAE